MKIQNGRMCDVDGCSETKNLTKYTKNVDLCYWHKYLAKRIGVEKLCEHPHVTVKWKL